MRARKPAAFCCLFTLLLSGCARNPAPQTWRLSAREAQQSVRGGWIVVELAAEASVPGQAHITGELLAIDEKRVHVLSPDGYRALPRSTLRRVTVVGYSPPAGALAVWASIGAASTLSHGIILIMTAPMWAAAGIVATARESRAGIIKDLESARRFARFPQGLPGGFDPGALGSPVPKP